MERTSTFPGVSGCLQECADTGQHEGEMNKKEPILLLAFKFLMQQQQKDEVWTSCLLTHALWWSSAPGEVLQARSCCGTNNVVIFAALERDFASNL